MNRKIKFVSALSLMVFSSCAATSYTYYGLWPSKDLMLAKDPKEDLSLLKTCEPDETAKGKCVAMLASEFFKMKKELEQLREELKQCQAGEEPKP